MSQLPERRRACVLVADDDVRKPFSPAELGARLQAVLPDGDAAT